MAETAITTAMITIACVVCASMLLSAIFPALNRASSSVVSSSTLLGERMETSIDIIAETNDTSQAYIYVKNIGASSITQIDSSDIFFGKTNDFQRIPYNATLSITPSWNYAIENDGGNGKWDGGETVNVTIATSGITTGDYFVKMILPNGISTEDTYSI
jgi:archaellum component FlaG (FlaF/FlaG flagellin family)